MLAALPVPSAVRAGLRLMFAVAVAVALWALLVLLVWSGPGIPTGVGDRLPEAVCAGAAATALALTLDRRGERGSGASGVAAGLMVPLFVATFAFRWPGIFPALAAGPIHDRWWVLVIALAAIAVRAGRDPGRR